MTRNVLFSTESCIWGLSNICRLHRVAFAPESVLRQVPPPYTLPALQQALGALGLRNAAQPAASHELRLLPLPCLAVIQPEGWRSAGGTGAPSPVTHRLALLLRCEAQAVLCIREGERQPRRMALAEFEREYAGMVLLLAAGREAVAEEAEAQREAPEFGFRWFVPELLRYQSVWRDVLLASLAIQSMALAVPVLTQIVFDKVIAHHSVNTLLMIGAALLVLTLFTALMNWVRQYLVLHTGSRIDAVLGAQVFEHLCRLPMRYFEHRSTGTLVARVQGVETIREFLSGAAVMLILDVPFMLVFLAIMFHYSWILTLATLAVLAVIAIISMATAPLLRELINRQFMLGARNQAFLTEYVSGMETVKSLQMEPQLNARFGDYLAGYLQAGFNTRQLANACNVATGALEQLLALVILCAGAWLIMTDHALTIGMLVAFQMFATRLSSPVLRMAGLWQQFQQANIAVKRLGDIMNAPAEPSATAQAREGGRRGDIRIRGLGFRHSPHAPYLYRGLDMDIEAGSCVAITGASGSGKSTLSRLLQGFYQAEEGAIFLDGRDLRHLPANELRSYFGVVPQHTTLFSGTIYDNLLLANPHADRADVIRACRLAGIHDDIELLPDGYLAKIGEQGVGLSGGQRQRLAIARALLRQPAILVFDEATSNLDGPAAARLAETINQLRGATTVVFITHHLPHGLRIDGRIDLGTGGCDGAGRAAR